MAGEASVPPPTPIAFVLCDNVYQDSHGKRALVGLFDRIVARSMPTVHPKMCVLVSLTSIRPNTICKLDIVHSETDEPIIVMQGPAPPGTQPIDIWDVVFELPPVQFREPGTYYVRFFGNERILVQRPIRVVLQRTKSEQERENKEQDNDDA